MNNLVTLLLGAACMTAWPQKDKCSNLKPLSECSTECDVLHHWWEKQTDTQTHCLLDSISKCRSSVCSINAVPKSLNHWYALNFKTMGTFSYVFLTALLTFYCIYVSSFGSPLSQKNMDEAINEIKNAIQVPSVIYSHIILQLGIKMLLHFNENYKHVSGWTGSGFQSVLLPNYSSKWVYMADGTYTAKSAA